MEIIYIKGFQIDIEKKMGKEKTIKIIINV